MSTKSASTRIHSTNRLVSILAAVLLGCLVLGTAVGAPGDLDSTFGLSSSGVVFTDITAGSNDKVYALDLQPTGEVVIAGSSDTYMFAARYTSAGLLDTTFSMDGKQLVGPETATAYAVALDPGGKVLLAGSTNNGVKDNFEVVRLTSAGGLDTTFNGSGVAVLTLSSGMDVARDLEVLPNGNILAAGSAGTQFALVLFDTNGNLVTTFGGGDGIALTSLFGSNDLGHAMAVQDDGMIVVVGQTDNGSNDDFAVARFDANGNLDTTFGGGDGWVNTHFGASANDFALAVAIQPDGKIVAAGYSDSTTEDFAVARYTSAGLLDTSFSNDGMVVTPVGTGNDQGQGVAIQGNGKIVVGGFSFSTLNSNDFALVRYNPDGSLDSGFGGGDGVALTDLGPTLSGLPDEHTDDLAYDLQVQTDNKIVLAGYTDYPLAAGDNNAAAARYESPNAHPTVTDFPKSGLEDASLTFAQTDFSASFSDADGDSLVWVQIVALPAGGSLALDGAAVSAGQVIAAAELDLLAYTPPANAFGSYSFEWNGSDGIDYADASATADLTILAVNDAPSFTKGQDQIANEDAGTVTVVGWASNISAGPANESTQVLTFTVTTDNDALFSTLPQVDETTGTLTFTPALNANGSALATIWLSDSGGVDHGGVNTSATQSFTITIRDVNDAPSFTGGANQTTAEDSGAQVVTGWATNISPGPADEAGQLVSFSVQAANPALFSAGPAVSPTGELTYTPAVDMNGVTDVTVTLSDNGGVARGGVDTSLPFVFTITISPVNDPPSFLAGEDQTVLEDSPRQTVSGWATDIVPGPANESGQTVSFNTETNRPWYFSMVPSISPAGVLMYTPMINMNGTAVVTVTLQDNGGGDNTSAPQTFNITITPVNDAPSFTGGEDQTTDEDSGPQTAVDWATSIFPGSANEIGQVMTFTTQTSSPALFSALPEVNAGGDLSYTPAPNLYGSAVISVTLQDDGGTANGGVDISDVYTFTITVNPVNDAPEVADLQKMGLRDVNVPFAASEFQAAFADIDGDALAMVKIAWLPANGTLTLDGTPVTIDQEIAAADLDGLVFSPDSAWSGVTVFGWNASDGMVYAAAPAEASITISGEAPFQIHLPRVTR